MRRGKGAVSLRRVAFFRFHLSSPFGLTVSPKSETEC